MNLGACPHCGKLGGVFQAMKADGSVRQLWCQNGEHNEFIRMNEKLTPYSDAVRRAWCHRIRRDWQAIDGELVRQGE